MKNIILKLILLLLINCNGVFGQDSVKKTTANIDSISNVPFKRNTPHMDSIKINPRYRNYEEKVIGNCRLAGLNIRMDTPKIDSIKPVDTAFVVKQKPKEPCNTSNIRICGPSRASLMSTAPLYVLKNDNNRILIDGLTSIASKSIEAINVLKDASATAMYGSRAANGVIEITLKEDSVFYSVEKLLSVYKLRKSFKDLPLYINGKLIPKEQLLLERSSVKSVRLVKKRDNGVRKKIIEVTTGDNIH